MQSYLWSTAWIPHALMNANTSSTVSWPRQNSLTSPLLFWPTKSIYLYAKLIPFFFFFFFFLWSISCSFPSQIENSLQRSTCRRFCHRSHQAAMALVRRSQKIDRLPYSGRPWLTARVISTHSHGYPMYSIERHVTRRPLCYSLDETEGDGDVADAGGLVFCLGRTRSAAVLLLVTARVYCSRVIGP